MLQITRWSPDTCDCVYEYEWDDSVLPGSQTHALRQAVRLCTYHKTLADAATSYAQVINENQKKNGVLGVMLNLKNTANVVLPNDPSLDTVAQANWRTLLNRTISTYKWQFDANRKLTVDFTAIASALDRQQLATTLNAKYGVGNVTVL